MICVTRVSFSATNTHTHTDSLRSSMSLPVEAECSFKRSARGRKIPRHATLLVSFLSLYQLISHLLLSTEINCYLQFTSLSEVLNQSIYLFIVEGQGGSGSVSGYHCVRGGVQHGQADSHCFVKADVLLQPRGFCLFKNPILPTFSQEVMRYIWTITGGRQNQCEEVSLCLMSLWCRGHIFFQDSVCLYIHVRDLCATVQHCMHLSSCRESFFTKKIRKIR